MGMTTSALNSEPKKEAPSELDGYVTTIMNRPRYPVLELGLEEGTPAYNAAMEAQDRLYNSIQEIHDRSDPILQEKIDEWFSEPDFGATITDELLKDRSAYSKAKHSDLTKTINSKMILVAQAETALKVARGDLESALTELKFYESFHGVGSIEA